MRTITLCSQRSIVIQMVVYSTNPEDMILAQTAAKMEHVKMKQYPEEVVEHVQVSRELPVNICANQENADSLMEDATG